MLTKERVEQIVRNFNKRQKYLPAAKVGERLRPEQRIGKTARDKARKAARQKAPAPEPEREKNEHRR